MPDPELSPEEIAINQEIVRYIPAWLAHAGLKQVQVAAMLGVSKGSVSKWLKGKQPVTGATLYAISRLCGTTPRGLLSPPNGDNAAEEYHRAAKLINALPPEKVERWLQLGEDLSDTQKK